MLKKIQYVYLLKKIYKMGFLEGSGVHVLYIGRTVSKG
jgi:Fe2+ transport system protein FeoA